MSAVLISRIMVKLDYKDGMNVPDCPDATYKTQRPQPEAQLFSQTFLMPQPRKTDVLVRCALTLNECCFFA